MCVCYSYESCNIFVTEHINHGWWKLTTQELELGISLSDPALVMFHLLQPRDYLSVALMPHSLLELLTPSKGVTRAEKPPVLPIQGLPPCSKPLKYQFMPIPLGILGQS